jgi:hypothetical protein
MTVDVKINTNLNHRKNMMPDTRVSMILNTIKVRYPIINLNLKDLE